MAIRATRGSSPDRGISIEQPGACERGSPPACGRGQGWAREQSRPTPDPSRKREGGDTMIDPAKLAAFAFVTGLVSLMPGPQMIFVMTQAAWRGPRAGAAALAGLQLGNATWFVMAGLGLGALAAAAPGAFTLLTAAGGLYLAWLGVQALRHAGRQGGEPALD